MANKSSISSENPELYSVLKLTFDNLSTIEAHHASVSKPTAPEYEIASFNHKYATLRGYKYHYVDEGDPNGELLILIHGFPDLWYGWRYQIRHLVKEGYRVIAIDNLGNGETDYPRCDDGNYDPYRTKNLGANLIDLLDQLNIAQAVFIGHDWGAAVAWRIGMHYPERCKAIISVGIPYAPPTAEYLDVSKFEAAFPQFKYWTVFQSKEPEEWFDADPKKMALAMFNTSYGSGIGTSVQEKQYYIDNYSRTTLHGGLNYYRAGRLNFEDGLPYVGKPFTVPALQVIVEKDPIITPAWVAVHPTDSIVNLKQVWISEGGHNVHTENPEAVNKALSEYLAMFFERQKNPVEP
ncbi:MAG: Alpha/Beta hydrolase protein [Benniella sp.]|nr:MAG: Alpha/Beta hydrolase protein [Benniella sp.]